MAVSAGSIKAGSAHVVIGMADRLTGPLKQMSRRLKRWGASVQNIGLKLAAAGGAIAAPLALSVRHFASAGDAVAKMARRTGLSTEAVSELGFAAVQSGADMATLEKGVRRMQGTINDAERGLSTATDAFDDLGLSAEQLRAQTPEQQFETLADALSQIPDPSKRAALAMQILGRAGTQLLPLMAGGAKGMRALRAEAARLGLTIGPQAAAAAEMVTDAMSRMKLATLAVVFQVGSALAPTVTFISDRMAKWAKIVRDFVMENKGLIVGVAALGGSLLAGGAALLGLGLTLTIAAFAASGLASMVSLAGAALAAMLSPVGLALVAIAALGAGIVFYSGAGGAALDWLKDRFGELSGFVGGVIGSISDALAAGDLALASEVLWSAMKLSWEKGTLAIRQVWESIWGPIMEVAIRAWAGVKLAWIEVRDWFESNFPEFTAKISRAFANMAATIRRIWAKTQNWLSDLFLDLGIIDIGQEFNVNEAKRLGQQDLNQDLREIEQKRRDAVAEADRRKNRTPEEREAEKQQEVAELRKATEGLLAAVESGSADRIAVAEAELKAAQAQLAAARARAAEVKPGVGKPGAPGLPALGPFDPAAVPAAVAQARNRIAAVGSFTARASQLLVSGDKDKSTDKIVEGLKKVEQAVKDVGDGLGAF